MTLPGKDFSRWILYPKPPIDLRFLGEIKLIGEKQDSLVHAAQSLDWAMCTKIPRLILSAI